MLRIGFLLLLSGSLVFAQEGNNRGVFLGLHMGQSDFSDWANIDLTDFNFDDTDSVVGVQLGYRWNRWIAIEGFYSDYGETRFDAIDFSGQGDATAYGVTFNASLPLGSRFFVDAKLGSGIYSGEVSLSTLSGVAVDEDDGANFVGALGFRYRIFGNLDLGLHYEAVSGTLGGINFGNIFGQTDALDPEGIETVKASLSYNF